MLDVETCAALNALLEDERAAAVAAAALANGATELAEREAFSRMGVEQVLGCCVLRERLELAAAMPSSQVSRAAFSILATEPYEERLRVYRHHLAHLNERVQALLLTVTERETRSALEDVYTTHAWAVEWCGERERAFAASRDLDFRTPRRAAPLLAVTSTHAAETPAGSDAPAENGKDGTSVDLPDSAGRGHTPPDDATTE